MASPTTAEAQRADKSCAVIDPQSQRGPEAVSVVCVFEERLLIANVDNNRMLRKRWIFAGSFNDWEELPRGCRFRNRVRSNSLYDTSEFFRCVIEDDLFDFKDLIRCVDHALNLQTLDDLAFQRSDAPGASTAMR